jgi:thiol-disulfide isomerase/thioredoxin
MLSKIRIDRKFWINLICFILGGILLVYLIFKYRVAPSLAFDEIPLTTPEGQVVKLSDYKGKVIFLNFWETWCGPCVQEMPTIEEARGQIDSAQMVFITIAEEDPAKIAAFRDRHDYKFKYFISGKSFKELGINTYPTSYIIDKQGKIIMTKIGGVDWGTPEMIQFMEEASK